MPSLGGPLSRDRNEVRNKLFSRMVGVECDGDKMNLPYSAINKECSVLDSEIQWEMILGIYLWLSCLGTNRTW
jgi:hypothetical protein